MPSSSPVLLTLLTHISFIQANESYSETDLCAFQCDLTRDDVAVHMPEATCDFATAFFVFSALGPSEWDAVVQNLAKVCNETAMRLSC